ncbi:MAG: ATP-binding protein [Thermodesulfobacteriota bacterium]
MKTSRGKDYLEILVEPYPYPVSYKGQYHYRSGSTKQELKGSALDAFLLKKYGLHWDGVPVPHLKSESLDDRLFTVFAKKALQSGRLGEEVLNESKKDLLKKLRLSEKTYLKRAAALLFCKDPEEFVSGAFIKIGFFRTDADLVYQDEIHGNLFEQVDKTIDLLLTKYMKAYISYEGIQRIERFLFPGPALREAVTNAVVHKDYSSANPIQISVYEDKIIIWNAGRLPEELPLERLFRKHPSIPYNPLIASAFFRAGYIEAWGRGIEKINHECRKAGNPPPNITNDVAGLMVTFKADLNMATGEGSPKSSLKSSLKTEDQIIELMFTNPSISTEEIGNRIGITKRAVLKQVEKLKLKGIIKRIGPAKGGYWKIQEKEHD